MGIEGLSEHSSFPMALGTTHNRSGDGDFDFAHLICLEIALALLTWESAHSQEILFV